MADYDKLKSYLSESKQSSNAFSFDSPPVNANSFLKFFKKSPNDANSGSLDQMVTSNGNETDSWFKEADSDPFCPKLSKKQRILGFMFCIVFGVFCMFLASFYIPVIILKARKFVLLFSMGSLFFIASFSFLWGFKSHLKHLLNKSRLPFTLAYFGTLVATVYYSLWVKSVVLTIIFASLQVGSLVWYLISYLPGGQSAFKLFAKLFYAFASKTVSTVLPI